MSEIRTSPKDAVIALMKGAVPERRAEIDSLWRKYHPDVLQVADAKQITLNRYYVASATKQILVAGLPALIFTLPASDQV